MPRAARTFLLAFVIASVASSVSAGTVTWQYAGTISGLTFDTNPPPGPFDLIPVGSPVTMSWTFDPAEPDICAGSQGVYMNQLVTLAFPGLTINGGSGVLLSGTNGVQGCVPGAAPQFSTSERELYFFPPVGPTPDPDIDVGNFFPGGLPPSMFWSAEPGTGSFPSTPPPHIGLFGPYFFVHPAGEPGGYFVSLRGTLEPVPEPASLLLLAGGLAGIVARRSRRPRE